MRGAESLLVGLPDTLASPTLRSARLPSCGRPLSRQLQPQSENPSPSTRKNPDFMHSPHGKHLKCPQNMLDKYISSVPEAMFRAYLQASTHRLPSPACASRRPGRTHAPCRTLQLRACVVFISHPSRSWIAQKTWRSFGENSGKPIEELEKTPHGTVASEA